jgi:Skp family chaperone for outer membrane proteins
MKRTTMLAVTVFCAGLFTIPAFGQTPPSKIGWIVTAAFGNDKEGITKYVNAEKALETEMKPRVTELEGLSNRIKTISDDLNKMQSNPAVPIDQKAAAAKQDEGQRLQREFEFKQKEAQAAFAKRREEVLGPLTQNIFQALQDYAKSKGFAVIIDISALQQENAPNPVLFLEPSVNVTKDFITYYNTRPATTASTAVPSAPKP